ncbi:MAG: acyl carrier protein [Firmicutes bacterium]|jgi:acyl carrier protein|nr:acyl carrier protein [Bacillota bacterium]
MEESKVMEIIAEQLGISASELEEDTILADLGADSLDLFQIISALEEEFEIEFDNEEAENLKTVGDAIEYIKSAVEK